MKKLLCLFLLCLVASTAYADNYISGEYEYYMPNSVDNKVVIARYTGDATEVVIPDELDGRPVAYLGPEIFYKNDALTSVTIPAGVTVDYAGNPFKFCSSLTNINISPEDPVLEIADGALINKMEKRLICYPRGLGITSYDVPEGVEIVVLSAFEDYKTLKSVTLPDSVKEIEPCAFYGCSKLSSISIPNGVTEIGSYAFHKCTKLDEVFIPASVKNIGEHAFDYVYYGYNRSGQSQSLSYEPCCTLVVVRNSYAESYARSNGIPFIYADHEPIQQGGATACPYCYGGWIDCSTCDTYGMCRFCGGAGYHTRYTSDGYEYPTCNYCGGTGACSRCGYSGLIMCNYCNGTGIQN